MVWCVWPVLYPFTRTCYRRVHRPTLLRLCTLTGAPGTVEGASADVVADTMRPLLSANEAAAAGLRAVVRAAAAKLLRASGLPRVEESLQNLTVQIEHPSPPANGGSETHEA